MITYVTEKKLIDKPISITCSVCRKSYAVNHFEAQEFLLIRHEGGYSSIFGDGTFVSAEICQHCLKKILGAYLYEEDIPSDSLYA